MYKVDLSSFFGKNPISRRTHLPTANKIQIPFGWRMGQDADTYRESLHTKFKEMGYEHIQIEEGAFLRIALVFVGDCAYHLNCETPNSFDKARLAKQTVNILTPLLEWCKKNCAGDYIFDERGLIFSSDEDLLLFRLSHNLNIKYEALA